jgi:hypothetical protein
MSEKKRQKKDGEDKNKKLQARRADNDEQHRADAETVRQGRANSAEGVDAPGPRGKAFSSPSPARAKAAKGAKGK